MPDWRYKERSIGTEPAMLVGRFTTPYSVVADTSNYNRWYVDIQCLQDYAVGLTLAFPALLRRFLLNTIHSLTASSAQKAVIHSA
ncbi:MAG: hypothetical protein GY703_23265 [Gammaproteobacteria bacterium]|nr:hypothetical protein [Gammaproteobacteria bacterium]